MSAVTGISGIQLSAASAAYAPTNSAEVSAIASAYVTGKQDALEFAYDADSAISSINGSALAGQGGASITAVSYDTATQQSSIVTATGFGIVDSATNYPRVSSVYLTDGQTRPIEANTLAPGAAQTSNLYTLRFSPSSSMWTTAGVAKGIYSPLQYGTGAGLFMDNGNFKGYLKGNELFVCNTGIGRAARLEVHQSRGSRLGLTGNTGRSTVNLTESELTIVNSALSTATLGRTKLEFKSPDSGTATFSHNYIKLYDTAESAAKTISSTSIDYWNGKADSSALSSYVPYSSLEYNTASAISGINGSALAAGSTYSAGEGIDITDDVISVEAPVDIVAGPGIVIDNPDGNTLRVSTNANYETLLWSGSANSAALSETMDNFSRLRVAYYTNDGIIYSKELYPSQTPSTVTLEGWSIRGNGANVYVKVSNFLVSARTAIEYQQGKQITFSSASVAFTSADYIKLHEVWGIHRIAGGN